jgi:hypothetical protein
MGRNKKIGKVHPISGVTIYNDGTCNASVSYGRGGYKYYTVHRVGKHGRPLKSRHFSLHRHVAELFIPNPDNKPLVNHKDGKKYNPKASNLEWVTHSENSIHAHKIGLSRKKLTAKDVVAIRKSTLPAYRICFKYDVSERHINSVRNRICWKHIP